MKHAPLWLLVAALLILALPARATRQTFPLREDGSISLWAMMAPATDVLLSATFTGTPFVLNTPEGERQVISGKITSGGVEQLVCEIENAAWPAPHVVDLGKLPQGEHRVEIAVPPLGAERTLRVI